MGSRYVTQTSVATGKKTAVILRSAIFLARLEGRRRITQPPSFEVRQKTATRMTFVA
jgi:hypothetical protein